MPMTSLESYKGSSSLVSWPFFLARCNTCDLPAIISHPKLSDQRRHDAWCERYIEAMLLNWNGRGSRHCILKEDPSQAPSEPDRLLPLHRSICPGGPQLWVPVYPAEGPKADHNNHKHCCEPSHNNFGCTDPEHQDWTAPNTSGRGLCVGQLIGFATCFR